MLAVHASPLPRTLQTAQLVLAELSMPPQQLQVHPGLSEAQAGDRESQLLARFDEEDHWFPDRPELFNGETSETIKRRITSACQSIYSLFMTSVVKPMETVRGISCCLAMERQFICYWKFGRALMKNCLPPVLENFRSLRLLTKPRLVLNLSAIFSGHRFRDKHLNE